MKSIPSLLQNNSDLTISTHNGSAVSVGHNLRNENSICNPDIDLSRTYLNETLVFEPIRNAYERLFGKQVKLYNERQTRPERQIKDYYRHVEKDAKKHTVYEMIVQVGDRLNIGNDNEQARDILKDFIFDWSRRNPNLELIGAFIHADEGTLHAHLDYIPVATGYVRGMAVQNGLDKALRQQGFDGKTATLTPQILWEKRENAYLESLCLERGLKVYHPERDKQAEQKRKHLETDEYKSKKMAEEIDENANINFKLLKQQTVLKEKLEDLEDKIAEKKELLEDYKGRIKTEKQTVNFKVEKKLNGTPKPFQTIFLSELKSLHNTAQKVRDGDDREKELDERENKINNHAKEISEKLKYREQNLNLKEKNLAKEKINIEKKSKQVDLGLYDNTNRHLNIVKEELKELKKFCGKIKHKDGSTALEKFENEQRVRKEELERIREFEEREERSCGLEL